MYLLYISKTKPLETTSHKKDGFNGWPLINSTNPFLSILVHSPIFRPTLTITLKIDPYFLFVASSHFLGLYFLSHTTVVAHKIEASIIF